MLRSTEEKTSHTKKAWCSFASSEFLRNLDYLSSQIYRTKPTLKKRERHRLYSWLDILESVQFSEIQDLASNAFPIMSLKCAQTSCVLYHRQIFLLLFRELVSQNYTIFNTKTSRFKTFYIFAKILTLWLINLLIQMQQQL